MAPVVNHLSKSAGFQSEVCVTAQHRQMLDQVLDIFRVTPDYDLNLMKPGQGLVQITAGVLDGLQCVLEESKPDIVLVHGDTTTSMAASLSAYYNRIPVGHVEAGLRTGNIYSPWPEEINRRVAGVISELHFAPTERAKENLLTENVPVESITVTGNTVIDALLEVVGLLDADEERSAALDQELELDLSRRLILVTGHRRESFGDGFQRICDALAELAKDPTVQIIYPLHLNPNVKKPVEERLSNYSNIKLISPLDYLPFIHLMKRSSLIITDSGGVQEEAPSLGKPVLVVRDTTERPEAVEAGVLKLVGTDSQKIVIEARSILDASSVRKDTQRLSNPYGDGMAATRILNALDSWKDARK